MWPCKFQYLKCSAFVAELPGTLLCELRAIGLHCFVVRQDIALGLLIQHVDIVVGQVDDPHPAAGRINDYRGG